MRRNSAFLGAAGVILFFDQLTKKMVTDNMAVGQRIILSEQFLSLTHVRNKGIAFGLLSDGGGRLKMFMLGLFTLLAIFFLIWLMTELKKEDIFGGLVIGLIAGGAFGNFIDRLRLGEVVDFIDFFWRQYHWPAFNVADSSISIGVALLMIKILFIEKTSKKKEG